MNNNNQIKLGAIISYLTIVFNIVAGFLYTPWLVKEIGQVDYGIYTLAMSVISFFLMDLGISSAISRFISVYRAKGEEYKIGNMLGLTYKIYIIIDIIILLILTLIFLLINNIFINFTLEEIIRLKVVFLIVGGFSLIIFPLMPLEGILISYEKFVPLKLFSLFQKIFSIILVVIALYLGFGLYSVVLINSIVNIIITLIKLIYIKRNIKIEVNFKYKNNTLLKEIFGFSIWITIITIAQRFIINIAPTLLGMLSNVDQISIFSIGVTLDGYVYTFSSALGSLFLPKVTKMVINKVENSKLTDLMIKVGRFQFLILGIIFIGLLTLGKEFIIIWMGIDFTNSYYVTIFLIIPNLIVLTQDIALNYLIAINEIKYRAYDYIIAALISLISSIILIPKYGAIGASIGAFLGYIIGHVILMNIIYYKIFNLDILKFFKECHLKLIMPMILTYLVGIIIEKFIPKYNITFFVAKSFLLFLSYIIIMGILGLNNYEKNLIKSSLCFIKNKFQNRKEAI